MADNVFFSTTSDSYEFLDSNYTTVFVCRKVWWSRSKVWEFLFYILYFRCKKHEIQTSGTYISKGKSFVEILGESSEYVLGSPLSNCPRDQITVRTPIDVLHLLHSKSEAPSNTADSDISLLPEVRGVLYCRLSCYNSCFGLTARGEIELVITLEAKNEWVVLFHKSRFRF